MKINIEYIDNEIIMPDNKVFNIEIENKIYFYRLINELNYFSNGSD